MDNKDGALDLSCKCFALKRTSSKCFAGGVAEVAVHHTRPASTNTQLSSSASCLLNDCCFLLFINASVLHVVISPCVANVCM